MAKVWQNKKTRSKLITFAMVLLAYGVIELLLFTGNVSSLIKGQLVPICAYIVMALSLNLTVGILGELSLGHAGFMSVGAFTGAVLAACLKTSVPQDWLRLLICIAGAGVAAMLAGFLVGIPVLRLRGDYLAIVTLAFGEIIKGVFNNLYVGLDQNGLHISMLRQTFSLGAEGKTIINGPMGVSGNAKISTFTMGVVLILFALIVIYNLVDSRAGRAIRALRDNDIAADSVGISSTRYKLMAFVISAALAGMAGSLFANNYSTFIAGKFDFNTSILILVFVVLGGLGNVRGSIIAATALTLLPELLRSVKDYRMLAYAVVLILVMLVTNNQKLKRYWQMLKKSVKDLFRKIGGSKRNG